MNSKQYQNKVKEILQETKLPPTVKSFMKVISEQSTKEDAIKEITLKEVVNWERLISKHEMALLLRIINNYEILFTNLKKSNELLIVEESELGGSKNAEKKEGKVITKRCANLQAGNQEPGNGNDQYAE
jgi:hypothetical protein